MGYTEHKMEDRMDGIIFDVDGTIWDATDTILEGFNEGVLSYLNEDYLITRKQLQSVFGKTMEELFAILFPTLSKEEQIRIGKLCMEHEDRKLKMKGGNLYTGMRELIQTLKQQYNIYIVSNCQLGYIETMLEFTGLGSYITDFLCYGETLQPKSFTIREIMRRNNLENVVYIGDTLGDQNACIEAGVPFIYVTYGFGEGVEAEMSVDEPLQILELIKQLECK